MAIEQKIICFFIDAPETLRPASDTSILFMRTAQASGYQVAFFTEAELFYENNLVQAQLHFIELFDDDHCWLKEVKQETRCLYQVDAVIIRKDPPFDQNYLYATYLLDLVMQQGVLVSNAPQGIRDANEKIFATHFADFTPPTLITSDTKRLLKFLQQHKMIVLKRLNSSGGRDIIQLNVNNPSAQSIILMMNANGARTILAQKFIPEVTLGDKRIHLINGEPLPYLLLRKPPEGGFLANTAAGGIGYVMPLTQEDRALCQALKPVLQSKNLDFVGIDVIHGFLTEINVTSPTGLLPIIKETGLAAAQIWLNLIDSKLKNS